jgi:hypothetical protein
MIKMMSPVHDDDTDYSDLDEEAPSAAPASRGPSRPKNREHLSERTPLLSTSPPPPAYADVTRLYGAPPYVARNESGSAEPEQTRHQDAIAPAHTRVDEPQSMGDPVRDAEGGRKPTKKRNFLTNRKALLCLVFVLAFSLVGLMSVTTTKHNKSDDQVNSSLNPGTRFLTNTHYRTVVVAVTMMTTVHHLSTASLTIRGAITKPLAIGRPSRSNNRAFSASSRLPKEHTTLQVTLTAKCA